ncbi:Sodium/calcium exchanger protein-domain-containing protein [Diaporthe sp. PMI_573]|nr:Sodium/calcium exchanger protein-domain-containing protein [Diaporthaceae sp. PMI_573]
MPSLVVLPYEVLCRLFLCALFNQADRKHIIEQESVPGPAAQYFESSDSSDSDSSSSSDSDSSGHSVSTAKKIKRAIRKGRTRKQSTASADADKPSNLSSSTSPVAESPSETVERTVSEPTASSSQEPVTLQLTEEAAQALQDTRDGKKTRKHKHKSRRKNKDQPREDAEAAAAAGAPVTAVTGGAAGPIDEASNKRVDFAVGPDLEAQPATTRPKPFSLRTLRPNLAKNLTQNVFTSPVNANSGTQEQNQHHQQRHHDSRPGLRRTQSMPSQNQYYRGQPGALSPIVPIVVNSRPLTQGANDEEDEEPEISSTSAVLLLLGSTALVALCAEFMVNAIDGVVSGQSGISEAFIGLILLPIVGNAAEHVTTITVAIKNKMDLAIGVAIGSSIQIAIFVMPLVVILGWIMNKDMSLYFTLFETISMFVSAFIVNFLVLDGRSNYLEGALLCAAYVIIAVAAFFYPDSDEANSIGGGEDNNNATEAKREVAALAVRGMAHLAGWQ